MKFFIPDLRDDPAAAEERWRRYLRDSPAPADSRRVFSLAYDHNGDRYEVEVGKQRIMYRRKTGPRTPTGTDVSAIIDAGHVLYVWSYGPPFGGWANPSLVGRPAVTSIEFFDG